MADVKIAGIQKLTLLDYPHKTAATLFLPGCNFRCPFCHNSELWNRPHVPLLDTDKTMAFLKKRRNVLDGIVITGGEPTLQDLTKLLQELKDIGYAVKLDTNGTHPEKIRAWLPYLDYIAMDIKNIPEKMQETADPVQKDWEAACRETISILLSGAINYEFRTTVIPQYHTPEDIKDIAKTLIPNAKRYYLQPFVQRDTVPDIDLTEPTDEMLAESVKLASPYVQEIQIRGRIL